MEILKEDKVILFHSINYFKLLSGLYYNIIIKYI